MLASYHNHTRWSDGADDLAAYIAAARSLGLDELGVSDHYTLAPFAAPDWAIPVDCLGEYSADVRRVAERTSDIALRLGVEADFFPETVAGLGRRLAGVPFEYVIGSVHFVDGFPIDTDAASWERLREPERDAMWRRFWRLVGEMAASGVFDVAAHLDLPKKFGYRPAVDLTAEAHAALDAIAAADMAIELNTSGWERPAQEAYPSPGLLRAARARDIPLLISADAHAAPDLTRRFAAARDAARQAGYAETVRYAGRRRRTVPL